MDNFLRSHDAAPVLITAILFVPIAAIILGSRIATELRKRHLGAMRSDLTRAMVEVGMSADDIVRVLHAATEADEVVRVLQAAKGNVRENSSLLGSEVSKAGPRDGFRSQIADSRV